MKILITGGLGHIGSYVLKKANELKKINKIYIIDNFSSERYSTLFNISTKKKKIFFVKKNLSDKNSLNKFPKVDIVLHLASLTNAAASIKVKQLIYKNNLGMFRNIVNYCRKNNSRLIHISSTSVYGKQKGFVDESCKFLKPQTPYAEIKLLEEKLLQKNKKKIRYISLRFATIAGVSPGMRFHTAVNKFCLDATLGDVIFIWKGVFNQYRPYLSLNDAFKVIKFIINKNYFDKDIYNVVTSNYTVKDIINIIKKFKNKIKISFVKSKIINQFSYKVSDAKLRKMKIFKNKSIYNDIKQTLSLFSNVNN